MSTNGKVGAARFFARYKRDLIEEGTARGYDMSTRSARRAFEAIRMRELQERLKAEAEQRKTEGKSHED